jgi:hypothetical protein
MAYFYMMKTFLLYPTEEQESMLKAFLETNNIPFFEDSELEEMELPQHVLDGIQRGQEDIEAGRSITLEEFKKKFAAE